MDSYRFLCSLPFVTNWLSAGAEWCKSGEFPPWLALVSSCEINILLSVLANVRVVRAYMDMLEFGMFVENRSCSGSRKNTSGIVSTITQVTRRLTWMTIPSGRDWDAWWWWDCCGVVDQFCFVMSILSREVKCRVTCLCCRVCAVRLCTALCCAVSMSSLFRRKLCRIAMSKNFETPGSAHTHTRAQHCHSCQVAKINKCSFLFTTISILSGYWWWWWLTVFG